MASIVGALGKRHVVFENLAPGKHFITTMDHGDANAQILVNRENGFKLLLAKLFSRNETIVIRVQHGNKVETIFRNQRVDEINCDGIIYRYYKSDGFSPKIIASTTADCPYLIIEGSAYFIRLAAVIHCGRRGVYSGIVNSALKKIKDLQIFDISKLRIGLWSGICQSCYEVGQDVFDELGQYSHFCAPSLKKKWNLSLAGIIKQQLNEAGINETQIEESGICPCCHRDEQDNPLFYSYRRGDQLARNALFVTI